MDARAGGRSPAQSGTGSLQGGNRRGCDQHNNDHDKKVTGFGESQSQKKICVQAKAM